jgi:predicted transcriptional regulator
MPTQTVTAHISKDLVARVDALAAMQDRPRGWAVKQALADWVAMEEERHRMTLEGLADVDAGRVVPQTEVSAWLKSLGSDNPLPRPQSSPKSRSEA